MLYGACPGLRLQLGPAGSRGYTMQTELSDASWAETRSINPDLLPQAVLVGAFSISASAARLKQRRGTTRKLQRTLAEAECLDEPSMEGPKRSRTPAINKAFCKPAEAIFGKG